MSTSKKTMPTPAPARRAPAARAQDRTEGLALGFEDIQTLIGLVGREPIDEFQFESRGVKLHIRKLASAPAAAPAPALAPQQAPQAPVRAQADTAQPDSERAEDPGIHPITSPIVGTFYRAPTANGAPFVQPGDFVKPGQTLCIVEAMKLMNEIECDVAGEVVAVMAENGQPVEYGERLFTIRVR
jgi:acetyl-CoA carboxylase biotin carboxyl carrier protein